MKTTINYEEIMKTLDKLTIKEVYECEDNIYFEDAHLYLDEFDEFIRKNVKQLDQFKYSVQKSYGGELELTIW